MAINTWFLIQQINTKIWFAIRSEIEIINGEKDCSRIKVDTDDDLSLNRSLKFPTLSIIARSIFQEHKILYPQIYLDECLCGL